MRLLSTRELADALGVSESSLKRWVDAGRIAGLDVIRVVPAQRIARGDTLFQIIVRRFQRGVIHQHPLCIVVAVQLAGEIPQIKSDLMRGQFISGFFQHLGIVGQRSHQSCFARRYQGRQICRHQRGLITSPLREHRADAGVCILHVIHGVLVRLR